MRTSVGLAILLSLSASILHAQGADWARLTIGFAVGVRTTSDLWQVSSQPVFSSSAASGGTIYPPDLFHIHRDIREGFSFAGSATTFSSPHIGLTLELAYLGMRFHDSCTVALDGGDPELATACQYVGSDKKFGVSPHDSAGIDHSASATIVQGGVMVRPFRASVLQPFAKILIGFASTRLSTVAMASTYGTDGDAALNLTIYQDYGWKTVRPVGTLGVGVTTAPSSGLQVHAELRETFMMQSIVTGPAISQNLQPPGNSALKGYPSILLGLDLALKRERGKRY